MPKSYRLFASLHECLLSSSDASRHIFATPATRRDASIAVAHRGRFHFSAELTYLMNLASSEISFLRLIIVTFVAALKSLMPGARN